MVQDLCFYLSELGVRIDGIGTTTLEVHGVADIDRDVDYAPSEDPVEAMSLLAAGIVTRSEITIRRAPIEFLEVELAILEEMGLDYDRSDEYPAANGRTRLVDLTVRPSTLRRDGRQDPPDAVPRASTSTTCRSSPSSRRRPPDRPWSTTGSTRTGPST